LFPESISNVDFSSSGPGNPDSGSKSASPLPLIRSCGFLIYRYDDAKGGAAVARRGARGQGTSFLLMQHIDRWDLPKGHVDAGESEMETALRELYEETGIAEADILVDRNFRFDDSYTIRDRKNNFQPREKSLVVFLAELVRPVKLRTSEHPGYHWFPWHPPHEIQSNTIDPLLQLLEKYWNQETG
jgi:8-oxo-dGTP pyrophosphatase MutT (NUDIX family)